MLYQASGAASILTESRPSPGDSREDSGEGQSSSPGVIPGGMGQRRSKRRAVQFQGIPGGVARGSVPRGWRRLDLHQWAAVGGGVN